MLSNSSTQKYLASKPNTEILSAQHLHKLKPKITLIVYNRSIFNYLTCSGSYKAFFLRQQRICPFFGAKLGHFTSSDFFLQATKH